MKKIVVIGSTGSVGQQTLKVVSHHREDFQIISLGANRSRNLLLKQAKEFGVKKVFLKNYSPQNGYETESEKVEIVNSQAGLFSILDEDIDLLVLAMSGTEAIYPLMYALERGIDVALANKEAIIAYGGIINNKLMAGTSSIIPLDSEHNALYQLLKGSRMEDISKIILTCSGGPFLNCSNKELKDVTPQMALSHPKWKMGKKITVDSATFMNKGFEVIEAHYLFSVPVSQIEVLLHPEAVVHGMVEFKDGTIMAELAPTDMKMSISYALGYPARLDSGLRIDWGNLSKLHFEVPDKDKIIALKIAYECLNKGMSYPAFLVKADEILVSAFLKGRIKFTQITEVIQEAINLHKPFEIDELEAVASVFEDAERITGKILKEIDEK